MAAIVCPWGFLVNDGLNQDNSKNGLAPPKARTFASIVSDTTESSIALSQLPIPTVRGEVTYIKISEDVYQEQLRTCRSNLIGRLLLRKGSMPMKTVDLKRALSVLWRLHGDWRLIPLGKGYFDIHLDTEDDMRRIWGGGACTLANGIFRLSQWVPDFQPGMVVPQTHAQVWVKFFGLSQDYWHPRTLMEIARGIGTPLQLDNATRERLYGYFARVLVDVDLTGELPSSIMVERENYGFPVEIVYENLPAQCGHCGLFGHMTTKCRRLPKQHKEC